MLTKTEAIKVTQDVLNLSPYAETEVALSSHHQLLTRFGDNRITQNVVRETLSLGIRANHRNRTARLEIDQLDTESVKSAYQRLGGILEMIAEASSPPALYPPGDYYPEIKRNPIRGLTSEQAAESVQRAVAAAKKGRFLASGIVSSDCQCLVLSNSKGLCLSDEISDSTFTCTMDGESGAARGYSFQADPNRLEVDQAITQSIKKCGRAQNPVSVEPGFYDVVLEPAAVAELVVFLGWLGLSGKAYLEKRSFCTGKLDQEILAKNVSLADDPLHSEIQGAFYDFQGVPKQRTPMIENGVLKNLALDLKTAAKLGRKPTGHGVAEPNTEDPIPWNLNLEWSGEKAKREDLISRVKRGLYVSQFHYTNAVDIMHPSVTGLTRNGLFLIENGKISKPVRNLRFTQSLTAFLNSIEAVTPDQERISTFFFGASLAPTVLARGFHFSSGTEF